MSFDVPDNADQLERLGQLVDKADNYLEYGKNTVFAKGLSPLERINALTLGLKEIRAGILAIYLDAGGTDEWAERDAE